MNEHAFETMLAMTRDDRDDMAERALVTVHVDEREQFANTAFILIFASFMLGVVVTAAGFLAGTLIS